MVTGLCDRRCTGFDPLEAKFLGLTVPNACSNPSAVDGQNMPFIVHPNLDVQKAGFRWMQRNRQIPDFLESAGDVRSIDDLWEFATAQNPEGNSRKQCEQGNEKHRSERRDHLRFLFWMRSFSSRV